MSGEHNTVLRQVEALGQANGMGSGRFPYATLVAVIRKGLDRGGRQLIRRIRQQLAGIVRSGLAGVDRRILIRVQVWQRHEPIIGHGSFKRSAAQRKGATDKSRPAAHTDAHTIGGK
jgi:hypothetical protein